MSNVNHLLCYYLKNQQKKKVRVNQCWGWLTWTPKIFSLLVIICAKLFQNLSKYKIVTEWIWNSRFIGGGRHILYMYSTTIRAGDHVAFVYHNKWYLLFFRIIFLSNSINLYRSCSRKTYSDSSGINFPILHLYFSFYACTNLWHIF